MKLSKRRHQTNDTGPGSTSSSAHTISFENALNAFLLGQNAAGHSKATQQDYKQVISLFLRYMTEINSYTTVEQITETDIHAWIAHLRNGPSRRGRAYSSRSIETYCRDVHVFFRWLVQHHHLEVSPMAQVKMPKVEKALIRVFTDDELKLLDAACSRPAVGRALTPDECKALGARDRAVLWLLLSTGIRLSELCGLLFSDIDYEKGMIYVRGKGAKERKVPFGKVARQHLNTYVQYWRGESFSAEDKHVFLTIFGRPFKSSTVRTIFKRLKRVADITDKRVSAHTCRHWFAVRCIKNGVPSTVVQGWLGHEELEQINTYVRLAEQDNQELYARHSPVDGLDMHHTIKGNRETLRAWRNARKREAKSPEE